MDKNYLKAIKEQVKAKSIAKIKNILSDKKGYFLVNIFVVIFTFLINWLCQLLFKVDIELTPVSFEKSDFEEKKKSRLKRFLAFFIIVVCIVIIIVLK